MLSTYLALLNGKPLGTSQLFLSEGVAGIYKVTVQLGGIPIICIQQSKSFLHKIRL